MKWNKKKIVRKFTVKTETGISTFLNSGDGSDTQTIVKLPN